MSGFIGQESLFKTINNFTTKTLPHTILFLGEEGCGRKTVSKYIASKLGIAFINVCDEIEKRCKETKASTQNVLTELLSDYTNRVINTVYLIDISYFDLEKHQNQLLKFIEEPPATVYIILINHSEIGILPTILSRCLKIRFEPYSINQLKQVKQFNNELAYKVCRTPGQLNNIDENGLASLYNLCKNSLTMSYEQLLGISTKINYKEDFNKFDFETFFNMLEVVLLDEFVENKNKKALQAYLYTIKRRQDLVQNALIAKEPFVINFLNGYYEEIK